MWLLLTIVLSYSIVCLNGNHTTTGHEYSLDCVSDYLFTINCSLSILPEVAHTDQSSYWLRIEDLSFGTVFDGGELKKTDGYYSCSLDTSHPDPDVDPDPDEESDFFFDTSRFKITLYHNRSNGHVSATLLDKEYMPVKHIKPNAPFNLTVNRMSSQHRVTWMSSYEKYLQFGNLLSDNLKYQLWFYRSGHQGKVVEVCHSTNISVNNENFEPDTEYIVNVRSIPNQQQYQGQWSEWATEVRWRTDPTQKVGEFPTNTFTAILCVLVPVLLILCYIPIVRLNKSTFIPTPAPYFQSLYADCEGDFRSWVVTPGSGADLFKTEETLQIDTLTETIPVRDDDHSSLVPHHMIQEGPSDNLSNPASDALFLGIAYAVSLRSPLPAPRGPLKSVSLSEPESTIEADSGCWLHSTTSLERESAWYSNVNSSSDYCTLSDTGNCQEVTPRVY
ncbi:interleukin-21 receptor [Oncorhynchus clarkii lewisi]|uniref:interleukin-21 receptor n=1 Tax=Oncorhynchus clarkii lewisi TaxID=490388 RepID=UPI0039B8E19B